jgi:predicted glycosyltransferase
LTQIIPTAVSNYDLLHNLKEEGKSINTVMKDLRTRNIGNYSQIKKRVKNVESQRNYKHKVWIIGDSHVRKCTAELLQTLDCRYEVMGFTKPGALTSDIVKTIEEIATFSSKHFMILWTGANDISKNNMKGALKRLSKFLEVCKSVNSSTKYTT